MRGALKLRMESLGVDINANQVMIHIPIFVEQELLVGFAALLNHIRFVEYNCKT